MTNELEKHLAFGYYFFEDSNATINLKKRLRPKNNNEERTIFHFLPNSPLKNPCFFVEASAPSVSWILLFNPKKLIDFLAGADESALAAACIAAAARRLSASAAAAASACKMNQYRWID